MVKGDEEKKGKEVYNFRALKLYTKIRY